MYLYRGLGEEYSQDYDQASKYFTKYDYFTDNPLIAKFFGEHVYRIKVEDYDISDDLFDSNGDRNFVVLEKEEYTIGELNGKEYIIYTDHENFVNLEYEKINPVIEYEQYMSNISLENNGIKPIMCLSKRIQNDFTMGM